MLITTTVNETNWEKWGNPTVLRFAISDYHWEMDKT